MHEFLTNFFLRKHKIIFPKLAFLKKIADSMLAAQTILKDRYIVESKIGQGGFGITYLATDSSLGIKVCIKELFIAGNNTRGENNTVKSEEIGSFSFQSHKDRFLREARKLAQFDHPNIVRITEVFEANHTAYMVMKYVEGENLRELVQREGALSEEKVLIIAHQLLGAVEEVHKNGLLHRDIAPDNLIWSNDQKLVLIDFGSIKDFATDETQSLTQTTILKHGYAPIEQYSSTNQLGTFSDIYAIAASLYFLLTATKPLAATDRNFQTLAELKSLNPKLSDNLANAIMKALSLKPADRFQKVEEFRKAIIGDKKILPPPPPKQTIKFWQLGLFLVVLFLLWLVLFNDKKENEQLANNEIVNAEIDNTQLKQKQDSIRKAQDIAEKEKLAKEETERKAREKEIEEQDRIKRIEAERKAKEQAMKEQKEKQDKNKQHSNFAGYVTDIDGNQYKTVKIGNQIWMAENLKTSRYRNGVKILYLSNNSDWKNTTNGAWCWYDNNSKSDDMYGKLYNWYVVSEQRELCPIGWHIPSDKEWQILIDYLGEKEISGNKMKNQTEWYYNGNGNNISGFSGLPGGYRNNDGTFGSIGTYGHWWSSSEDATDDAWRRYLDYYSGGVGRSTSFKEVGFSVRCIKD
jgi:uncharacterized protein (TIGR02145 family)